MNRYFVFLLLGLACKYGFCQNTKTTINPNISGELVNVLKSYEGFWVPADDKAYFDDIEIRNGYILWVTSHAGEYYDVELEDHWNDSIITSYKTKEFTLKDTLYAGENIKIYRGQLFTPDDSKCAGKARSLKFVSKSFGEPWVKVDLLRYCDDKLLLIMQDNEKEFEFWFRRRQEGN